MRRLVTAVVIAAIAIAAAFLFRPEMDLLYDNSSSHPAAVTSNHDRRRRGAD